MNARRAWIGCAVAGVLAFVASYLFGRIPDLQGCGPSNGLGAIIAFEFVRSPADVAALFGSEPCRSALVAAQRTGLLLDGLWFIPAYTAFLVLAARASGVAWWRWVAGALIVAGLSDEVEGVILWTILGGLPGTPGQIDALWVAVHLKFLLLAIGTGAIGTLLMPKRFGWRSIPGTLIGMGGIYTLLRLLLGDPAAMMQGFAGAWFALLATAITASFWPSLFSAPAAPRPDPAAPAA